MMFHPGDLRSGIALALQQGRSVVCFVTDDQEESTTWEAEWLVSHAPLLAHRAVVLRIPAGSQEAGFLAAFCPVAAVPGVVVIRDGQLKEQLSAGISREEFDARLRKVLGEDEENGVQAEQHAPSEQLPASSTTSSSSPPPPTTASPASLSPPTNDTQSILAERAQRLQEQHRLQQGAEAAARASKAKGKQKAVDDELAAASSDPTRKAQLSAAAAARLQKQKDKAELERVLARIEADKEERRAEAQRRRHHAAHPSASSSTTNHDAPEPTQRALHAPSSAAARAASKRAEVHLHLRLFDGSSLRAAFPRTASLRQDVRPWIDRQLADKAGAATTAAAGGSRHHPPYTFKHILTPLPNRSIEVGEEDRSLDALDLFPSATLVLVPVRTYAEAYAGGGGTGLAGGVTGLVSGAFGLVTGALGRLGGAAVGAVTGYAAGTGADSADAAAPAGHGPGSGDAERSGAREAERRARIRTLADQRAESEEAQLYNGNQLNFEPRRKEGEGEEGEEEGGKE